MLVASLSSSLTTVIGDHGLYAVFALMLIDAVFPAASELVMVYARRVAVGRVRRAARRPLRRTDRLRTFWAYVAIALAGTIGYTVGSLVGWGIGLYGGRPLLERHGRWLHLTPEKLDRAERWFEPLGRLGRLPRPPHARRALVRLDPGRRLPHAARPLHAS